MIDPGRRIWIVASYPNRKSVVRMGRGAEGRLDLVIPGLQRQETWGTRQITLDVQFIQG